MSISLWVRTYTTTGIASLVTKWYQAINCGGDGDTYGVWLMSSSQINYTNNNDVWVGFSNRPSLSAQQLGKWTHVVVTSSSVNGQKIYFNSVLAATNLNGCLGSVCSTTGPLTFAAESQTHIPNMHRFLTGDLDDIGIWSRVLTKCEIDNLYLSMLTNCSSVGIEAVQNQTENITIYPNPASGNITISGYTESPALHCKIWDVSGKLAMEKEILNSGTGHQLNLDLQKGIYLLEITGDQVSVTHRKLIIE